MIILYKTSSVVPKEDRTGSVFFYQHSIMCTGLISSHSPQLCLRVMYILHSDSGLGLFYLANKLHDTGSSSHDINLNGEA